MNPNDDPNTPPCHQSKCSVTGKKGITGADHWSACIKNRKECFETDDACRVHCHKSACQRFGNNGFKKCLASIPKADQDRAVNEGWCPPADMCSHNFPTFTTKLFNFLFGTPFAKNATISSIFIFIFVVFIYRGPK
jgi:hypothetical protein